MKRTVIALTFCAAVAEVLPAQTFAVLYSFNLNHSQVPLGTLIQATNGDLYGTTQFANNSSSGTVFRVSPQGRLATEYVFCSQTDCADGVAPWAGLVQGPDGNLYGTTSAGGNPGIGGGTIFKIAPGGSLTTLYSFCSQPNCVDGLDPIGVLVQATSGELLGTTDGGGAAGHGTVFEISPHGTFETLYSFCSQPGCTDGSAPYAGLMRATNGDFYGTTLAGGAAGDGVVFKITSAGALTPLYSFCGQPSCADGADPHAPLVQAANGEMWGTTASGGAHGNGTVFKITPSGELTTVYSFCAQTACADGSEPYAGLIEGSDGNFYGTTVYGGANGYGAIFSIAPDGGLVTLHSFCQQPGVCADGSFAMAGLVQDTNGTFYGTAGYGGIGGGTVFSLSMGLKPFVRALPAYGPEGTAVDILGTDLGGATSVTFNGVSAVFQFVSGTEITTNVPVGAITGRLEVVTPSGTLKSNAVFRVPR